VIWLPWLLVRGILVLAAAFATHSFVLIVGAVVFLVTHFSWGGVAVALYIAFGHGAGSVITSALTRLLAFSRVVRILNRFDGTSFQQKQLSEYLAETEVQVAGKPTYGNVCTGKPIFYESGTATLYGLLRNAYLVHHETPPDAEIAPAPHFAVLGLPRPGFVFTTCDSGGVHGLGRFIVLHELGHCSSASSAKWAYFHKSMSVLFLVMVFLVGYTISGSGPIGFAALLLIVVVVHGLCWVWPSRVAAELCADIFAVAHMPRSELRDLLHVIKVRPNFLYDRQMSSKANRKRLQYLRVRIIQRRRDPERFYQTADLISYSAIMSGVRFILAGVSGMGVIAMVLYMFTRTDRPSVWAVLIAWVVIQLLYLGLHMLSLHVYFSYIYGRLELDPVPLDAFGGLGARV